MHVDASGKILREAKVLSQPDNLIGWFRDLGLEVTRIGLEAGPLSQWLYTAMKKEGLAVELLETRHVHDAFKAMPVSGRGAGRGHPTLEIIGKALLAALVLLFADNVATWSAERTTRRAAQSLATNGGPSIEHLSAIARVERRQDERVRLVMSAPGVGPIVGLTYVAAIDDPARFTSSKQGGRISA